MGKRTFPRSHHLQCVPFCSSRRRSHLIGGPADLTSSGSCFVPPAIQQVARSETTNPEWPANLSHPTLESLTISVSHSSRDTFGKHTRTQLHFPQSPHRFPRCHWEHCRHTQPSPSHFPSPSRVQMYTCPPSPPHPSPAITPGRGSHPCAGFPMLPKHADHGSRHSAQ